MFYKFDEYIAYMKEVGLKTQESYNGVVEERLDLEELSDFKGFEYIEEDGKSLYARRPYYRLRGKKVTKEQAFDIISKEKGEINLHYRYGANWIRSFIDTEGNVGETTFLLWKNPTGFELLEEHMLIAKKYPYLEYVIIYTGYDEGWTEEKDIFNLNTILYDMRYERFVEWIDYALWVHDGGVERVDNDKALQLYKKYQAEYPCEEMFLRNDWNKYIKPYLDEGYLERLCKEWKVSESEKEELLWCNIPDYQCALSDKYNMYKAKTVDENYEGYLKRVLEDKERGSLTSHTGISGEYKELVNNKLYEIYTLAAKEAQKVKNGELEMKDFDLQFYWDIVRELLSIE